MIEIQVWESSLWSKDKNDILEIEKRCFSSELEMDEQEVYESISEGITVIARDVDKIIGITYANDYSELDVEWFDGWFNPKMFDEYVENKTLYITSTAVLPEYRNQEIAIRIRIKLIEYCRNLGYKYIIGHAHKGSMANIYKIFGGGLKQEFKKWYGSKQTHYLCELNIESLIINYVPKVKQQLDYDCALASLHCLFGENQKFDLKMSPEIGTSHEAILMCLLKRFPGDLYSFESFYNSSISDLQKEIKKGNCPIVNYIDDGEGHYSVIMGMSSKELFIRDVWDGKIKRYTFEKFLKIWKSKIYGYRWYLVINKNG